MEFELPMNLLKFMFFGLMVDDFMCINIKKGNFCKDEKEKQYLKINLYVMKCCKFIG